MNSEDPYNITYQRQRCRDREGDLEDIDLANKKYQLIMLFTEALIEPLWGWVKSYRPTTLSDAIRQTRYFQDVVLPK